MVYDEKTQEKSSDFSSKTSSFSKLLEGVVLAANNSVVFQGQFGMSHQEALGTVTVIADQALCQRETPDESLESSSKPPPISQSDTASQNSETVKQEHISSHRDNVIVPKSAVQEVLNVQNSEQSTRCSLAVLPSVQDKVIKRDLESSACGEPKTPKSDTYSWRKYGQKHVKNSGSSRSYFRCTNSTCCAKKKVQHFDQSGEIIEVVYKGNHNHDPPPYIIKGFSRKKSFNNTSVEKPGNPFTEEPKQVLQLTYECHDSGLNDCSVGTVKSDVDEQHIKTPDTTTRRESDPSTLPREVDHGRSSNSTELALMETMNDRDIPIKKRRIKESGKESSQSVYRTFKEPKIVVHAAGDSGISSDGYRWRKYGQKMVKGNVHPRSYYRCSSPGCPVRKHVERATDGSLAMVAMYEGEHDHEKPLPKKQQSSLKPSIPVNAHPDTANNSPPLEPEEEKTASPSRVLSSTKPCQVSNNECGEPKAGPEAGTPKALDSSKTLLSIGIELESC
ncbi:hypothetical protein vseg_006743 [Gypsophila vaccaria]